MLPIIDSPSHPVWLRGTFNTLIFLASLVMLERSADIFVDSTAIVAKRFGLPTVLVGLLTAGAEWEELAVVVSSLAQDNPSLALSNIYGSSIANILGSFSIGLLFAPASLEGIEVFSARIYTTLLVILYIGIAALALPPVRKHVGSRAGRMGLVRGRIIGGLLVGIFVIYVGAIAFGIYRGIVIAPEDSDSDDDESEDDTSDDEDVAPRAVIAPPVASDRTPLLVSHPQDPSTPRSIPQIRKSTIHHLTLLIISTILLSISGYLLASTTSNLAILLGLYQSTAGLTILSIATTLPEKLVAFKAGMKKQSGVLIANTVGSCVFLGTLVLGIVYLVRGEAAYENDKMSLRSFSSMGEVGVVEGKAELLDVSVVLASAVILWAIVWYGKFKRWFGVAMLLGYVVYMVSVVMRLK